jgi:hypothetical protein
MIQGRGRVYHAKVFSCEIKPLCYRLTYVAQAFRGMLYVLATCAANMPNGT